MSTDSHYLIPAGTFRAQIEVLRSRFIATVTCVNTPESAKEFITSIRGELSDASHHVYAFRVGYGNSVIEGMSDDGEPTGTAGPPILSILRGTDIGDIAVVVTRYWGGTKLGTGGLVRAYSDATRQVLTELKTEAKIEKTSIGVEISYSLYERVKLLVIAHDGTIEDESFAGEVSLILRFPINTVDGFVQSVIDLSAGRAEIIYLV